MPSVEFVIENYKKNANSTAGNDLVSSTQTNSDIPNQPLDSTLLHEMKRIYNNYYYEDYENNLPKKNYIEFVYPQFTVKIDEEDYEVILDFGFFELLCDIYIIDGWQGIKEIENKMSSVSIDDSKVKSGDKKWDADVSPQNTDIWKLANKFFLLTRNILGLLICETLGKFEKHSAERVISKLSIINIKITDPWSKYQILVSTEDHEEMTSWDSENIKYKITKYTIGAQDLSKDLYLLLKNIVEEKNNFNNYARKSDSFRYLKIYAQDESIKRGNSPIEIESARIHATEYARQEIKYNTLKEATEKILTTLKGSILDQHPLALLIYNSLEKGFTQEHMENIFGLTLDNLRKNIESVAEKVDPKISHTEQIIPISQFNNSGITSNGILSFVIPNNGIEQYVMNEFLNKYKNPTNKFVDFDTAYLPMLSEDNLSQLLEDADSDSFEYVVGMHYLRNLILKLGEIEAQEKVWNDFWKLISKISSGLSLASLVTPATAEFAPIFRGGAAIADLALLAYTLSTITGSLKLNNELMDKSLVGQNDYTNETFAIIGEVISLRKEFADNLDAQIAQELINSLIGQRLPVFKEFLIARNYYNDFENLVDIDDSSN